jgi:dTDP-4-dehydrorhamnose reductase
MKLLLLGANGQLGQEITAAAPAEINVISRARAQTDVADAAMIAAAFAEAEPDVVVNAAAYTKVDKAETERENAFRVNAAGPGVIAETAAASQIPLIHISTDYVFDGLKRSAYVETDSTAPLGVYGASKLAGEQAVRNRHQKHVILRTSWVYGRYGTNFLKTMLRRADEQVELRVVADQRGCPTSTVDIAAAILTIAPRLVATGARDWGTYHFAGEGETNWWEFAGEILNERERITGKRAKISAISTSEHPTLARRPMNSVLNSSLIRKTFGLRAKPWRHSVKEAVGVLLAPSRG